jgi:hypothetical protein
VKTINVPDTPFPTLAVFVLQMYNDPRTGDGRTVITCPPEIHKQLLALSPEIRAKIAETLADCLTLFITKPHLGLDQRKEVLS